MYLGNKGGSRRHGAPEVTIPPKFFKELFFIGYAYYFYYLFQNQLGFQKICQLVLKT